MLRPTTVSRSIPTERAIKRYITHLKQAFAPLGFEWYWAAYLPGHIMDDKIRNFLHIPHLSTTPDVETHSCFKIALFIGNSKKIHLFIQPDMIWESNPRSLN